MNRQKYNELVKKKLMLESKLSAIREHQRRNSLSFLIEDTIEKAEIVLAAKAIVDHFGKMAEDTAKIEGDDLMPMMDSLKAAFGQQMAQSFQSAVTDQTRTAVQSLTQIKDAVSNAVGKLEAIANGNAAPNDMATDPMNDPVDPMADPGQPDMSQDADQPDMGQLGADGDDPLADEMGDGPLGRTRKESVENRARPLTEGLLDSIKGVLTAHFDDVTADRSPREQLEALKPFISAADYEVAAQFPDSLLASVFDRTDASVGMPVVSGMDATPDLGGVDIEDGAGLDNVPALPAPTVKPSALGATTTGHDSSVVDIAADAGLPVGSDPLDSMDDMDEMDMDSMDSMDSMDQFDSAVDPDSDPLDAPFESARSPARRLREAVDPDAVIYKVFSRVVKEGFARRASAQKVAEKFGIDYSDVVSVIKEAESEQKAAAAAVRPGRDWKRIYREAKEDGLTRSAIIMLIREGSVDRRDEATIRSWIVESEKQDAIFGKKKDKAKDDCDTDDDCDDVKKVDEAKGRVPKKFIGQNTHEREKKEAEDAKCGACNGTGKYDTVIRGKVPDCSACHGTGKKPVSEKVNRTRRSLDSLEREAAYGKKIKLDKGVDKKEEPKKVEEAENADCEHEVVWINKDNESQTNTLKSKAAAEKFAAQIKQGGAKAASVRVKKVKVDEAEGEGLTTAEKAEYRRLANLNSKGDLSAGEKKRLRELRKKKEAVKIDEAEGDTGFNSVSKATYPEASAPAFRSNSGKGGKGTDKSEKPMVVGGQINPSKGNPAQAGKMSEGSSSDASGPFDSRRPPSKDYDSRGPRQKNSNDPSGPFDSRRPPSKGYDSRGPQSNKDSSKRASSSASKKDDRQGTLKLEAADDVTGLPTAPNRDRGFPEATNPAFKKNTKQSGKTDKPGMSPVVGGSEPNAVKKK